MSSKTIVVIKEEPGCTVLTNPEKSRYLSFIHVVNPDLSNLRGIPPELWDISDGKVVSLVDRKAPPVSYKNEDEIRRSITKVEYGLASLSLSSAESASSLKQLLEVQQKRIKILIIAVSLIGLCFIVNLLC